MNSVWFVIDAINAHSEVRISYPADHEQQQAIGESFRRKSAASFECCAGAIDGILVWIHKPSAEDCARAGCSEGKFFVVASTSMDSTAKQFAIHGVNF